MKSDFDFSDCVRWSYPLTLGERRNFIIRRRPLPCEWAEENLHLVSPAYLYPGKFKAWPYQREPINSFHYWQNQIFIGPVQSGKSLIAETCMYYTQAVLGLNFMIAYANEKKSGDAFDDRFVPMIQDSRNKELYDNWDKKDDSLTKGKLKLISCIGRIASARNKDDLASFTGPVVYGSEVAKWQIKELKFDPVLLLKGRGDAAFALYNSRKCVLESSPYEEGDLLYREVFRNGTLILQPHYMCPHCGQWQTLTDYQIKLRDPELKGQPAKIRELKEAAVWYQCIKCEKEITESDRVSMADGVVWAAPEINKDEFIQKVEEIDLDGSISGRLEGGVRRGYDTVAYWWSRLSDVTFPFWECLARFFESLHDNEKKKSYENETMARWWRRYTERVGEHYLQTKKFNYTQWGGDHKIPEDILVITLGIDSQDDGFYYAFVGWSEWLRWTVLRQAFIPCPRVEKGYEPDIFKKVMSHLYIEPLLWCDGSPADISVGGIDRGGHRPDDVDFIVKHFPGRRLFAYVGLARKYEDRPLIYKSEHGDFYLGQSDPLSEDTGKYIANEGFRLPMDVDSEFIKHLGRQFHQKKVDASNRVKVEWVHNFQGPDHYRDCLNINLAAGIVKGLDKMLLNPTICESLRTNRGKICHAVPPSGARKERKTQYNHRQYFGDIGGRL
jgi:hypothetical protein